jgi:hypothetical protein
MVHCQIKQSGNFTLTFLPILNITDFAEFTEIKYLKKTCKIYKALIKSVVLYGSESWTLTKVKEYTLIVFKDKSKRDLWPKQSMENKI